MLIFSYQYIIIQIGYTTHREAVRRGMLLLDSSIVLPKSASWQSAPKSTL